MFFYRDPEEVEKEAADALAAKIAAAEGSAEAVAEPQTGDWDPSLPAISAQPAESPYSPLPSYSSTHFTLGRRASTSTPLFLSPVGGPTDSSPSLSPVFSLPLPLFPLQTSTGPLRTPTGPLTRLPATGTPLPLLPPRRPLPPKPITAGGWIVSSGRAVARTRLSFSFVYLRGQNCMSFDVQLCLLPFLFVLRSLPLCFTTCPTIVFPFSLPTAASL